MITVQKIAALVDQQTLINKVTNKVTFVYWQRQKENALYINVPLVGTWITVSLAVVQKRYNGPKSNKVVDNCNFTH